MSQSCISFCQNVSSRRTQPIASPARVSLCKLLAIFTVQAGLGCSGMRRWMGGWVLSDVEWVDECWMGGWVLNGWMSVEWVNECYPKFRWIVALSSSGSNSLECFNLRMEAIKFFETSEPVIHQRSVTLQKDLNSEQQQFRKLYAVLIIYPGLSLQVS